MKKTCEGDAILEGNEEQLRFYSDNIYVDQARAGVNTGGRMTQKRTLHSLREIAKARQSEWWARAFDELFFMYLSGGRGINPDYIFPLGYTGRANNGFFDPDAEHYMTPSGNARNAIVNSGADDMSLALIDKLVTKAVVMGGGTTGTPQIQPIMVEGEERFVLVMHPWQVYKLRTTSSTGQWMDIQKAAAAAEGRNNPIFKGGLGMYNNVVLHEHKAVVRSNTAGAGANINVARALFLGEQAGVIAFGSPGSGMRFDWHEEMQDRGNQVVITTSSIFGIKKTRYNDKDFGLISADTYVVDPAP